MHTSLIWALIDAIRRVYSSICLQNAIQRFIKQIENLECA